MNRPLLRTVLALLVGALVGTLSLAGAPAWAHAGFVGSDPEAGSTLSEAPAEVSVRFSENVRTPAALVVSGPSGKVTSGPVEVRGDTVSVPVELRPDPAYVGRYTLAYRVVSADGHAISDEVDFEYRPAGVTAASPEQGPTEETSGGRGTMVVVIGVVVLVLLAGGLLLGPVLRRALGHRAAGARGGARR